MDEPPNDLSWHEASFGSRLRHLRETAGLTQEELADRAGLSRKAVGVLERGERKRPYPHTVRALADALGLSGDERGALISAVSRPPTGPVSPAPVPRLELPTPPTPMLGRERELREIRAYLRGVRLLTLTGIGGVGKTRLALEAVRASPGEDLAPDGVVFVSLAPLGDVSLVVPALAQALGLRDAEGQTTRETLHAYLRERRLLLVLDNFEHVLEAASEVAALIGACKHLTLLVTSRAPLRIRGEQEYPVQPLGLPASTRSPDLDEVMDSASGRLFVERAAAASPAFDLTVGNAGAVASICWRLAGLPLALELAAAHVRFLDPAALLPRLDRALSIGGGRDLPARQRTMRATLGWSYDLLSPPERALFRSISVFMGGFELEAAEEVGGSGCVAPDEVVDLLGRLVEQSLVRATPRAGDGLRYEMLEPVRQYALEKLREGDGGEEARRRHAEYHLKLAELAGSGLKGGPEQPTWLRRLEVEHDNLRSALGWHLARGEAASLARMGWPLWRFWWLHGHFIEGRRWMEEALKRTVDPAARAKLLFVAGTLAHGQADFEAAGLMHEESLALFRQLGDEEGAMHSLGSASIVSLGRGRYEEGFALVEECVNLGMKLGDRRPPGVISGFAAATALAMGDHTRARRLAERGLRLSREVGARDGASIALHTLATLARTEGCHDRAARLFGEGLTLSAQIEDRTNVALCLEGLAAIAAAGGDTRRAARLWGASEAMLETIEVTAYANTPDRILHRREVEEARKALDARTWEREWAEGRRMSSQEAISAALG